MCCCLSCLCLQFHPEFPALSLHRIRCWKNSERPGTTPSLASDHNSSLSQTFSTLKNLKNCISSLSLLSTHSPSPYTSQSQCHNSIQLHSFEPMPTKAVPSMKEETKSEHESLHGLQLLKVWAAHQAEEWSAMCARLWLLSMRRSSWPEVWRQQPTPDPARQLHFT